MFSVIFLDPVDLEEFPDYEDFVDTPMDLGSVRTKLETRKYQAPEQFARDMRRWKLASQQSARNQQSITKVIPFFCYGC